MGNAKSQTRTEAVYTVPDPKPAEPAAGFRPPQTLNDLRQMLMAMVAFYVKSGGKASDILPPQKIPTPPVLEDRIAIEDAKEKAALAEALKSHHHAIGRSNAAIRRAAQAQIKINKMKKKQADKDYDAANAMWSSSEHKTFHVAMPPFIDDELATIASSIGSDKFAVIKAIIATALGYDLSKLECNRSRFLDSPTPATKTKSA